MDVRIDESWHHCTFSEIDYFSIVRARWCLQRIEYEFITIAISAYLEDEPRSRRERDELLWDELKRVWIVQLSREDFHNVRSAVRPACRIHWSL